MVAQNESKKNIENPNPNQNHSRYTQGRLLQQKTWALHHIYVGSNSSPSLTVPLCHDKQNYTIADNQSIFNLN